MLLAELEIWHSRPIAPTRRVALGRSVLPTDPPPGFGGLLLGGIVAAHVGDLDADLLPELGRLVADLEASRRIPQPRLRHRLQVDHIGLARSRHRLIGRGDVLDFEFDDQGTPASQILGAVYAAGALDPVVRFADLGGANADDLTVERLSGLGHFLPEEAPGTTVAAIRSRTVAAT